MLLPSGILGSRYNPNVLHNGQVEMHVIAIFLSTSHKAGWCIGAAQHYIIAEKRMSFQVRDPRFLIYKIVLVITSVAKSYCGD